MVLVFSVWRRIALRLCGSRLCRLHEAVIEIEPETSEAVLKFENALNI